MTISDAKTLEDLLWKERANTYYWRKKSEEYWELFVREKTSWRLHVGSPLVSPKHLIGTPSAQGYAWQYWAAFCPCCKRPIDISLERTSEDTTDSEELTQREDNQDWKADVENTSDAVCEKLSSHVVNHNCGGPFSNVSACGVEEWLPHHEVTKLAYRGVLWGACKALLIAGCPIVPYNLKARWTDVYLLYASSL